ncbi:MAG: ATPase, T2SS/T4P/T4SS family [Candidatus Omnitrophica bacterium]|nr:ATPase, T2SS/T4P/T4SS family [Candidatus Omnitrophota bacterium]
MEKERIEIERAVLENLAGKILLLQDPLGKREVIFQAFLEVYNSPRAQKFVKRCKDLNMDKFFQEFLSYGLIEEFLADPDIEDIMINYLSPIYIHKTRVGMIKTDKAFSSREELDLLIKKLIIFSGRKAINKINNVELSGAKGRVNIIYSPFGPQITITRAKERILNIVDLIKSGTINAELAAQFWLYVEGLGIKPANIIISGGPGTGKTTLLNALFGFMPSNQRIVVIEDTLELNTDLEENCSRLESDDEITLADLVKNSLRMRPDRVIVGEVRGKEALDLMTAMNIGKFCMGTLHASTPRETIMRLENEPMNVPEVLINLVDVFVIMRRYNVEGKIKRVVGELAETAGMEDKQVLLSALWTYDLSKLDFHESAVSSVYRDRVALVSGRSSKDIIGELKLRTRIIKALVEKDISDSRRLAELFRRYSHDPHPVINELGLKEESPRY